MALNDRPGLWIGPDADLGTRQLAAPGGAPRSHLVQVPPPPSVGVSLELHARLLALEEQVQALTARVQILEQPGAWARIVTRVQAWWSTLVRRSDA